MIIVKVFCLLMVFNSINEFFARKLNMGSISDNSVLHYSHTMNGNINSFSVDYELPTIDKIQKFINT